MLSADETQTTGSIERPPRPMSRRELLNERRRSILQQKQADKQTDSLPGLNGDSFNVRVLGRQLAQLQQENERLHWELEEQHSELQQVLAEYNRLQGQSDKDIVAIHAAHQQEIEQYQNHLRDMIEEQRQMQESHQQLEQRYQQLYHSFQDAVEEEARKMVAEAAQTIHLSPEHAPALLQDVVKTLESQVKQEEDQHLAQTLYLLREAQRKNRQLEEEYAKEREKLAAELQNLLVLQNSARQQAQLRASTLEKRLKARWATTFTVTVVGCLLLLLLLQWVCYAAFRWEPPTLLLVPALACAILAAFMARFHSTMSHHLASAPRKVAASKKG